MSITQIGATQATPSAGSSPTTTPKAAGMDLGQDAFMQLLLAQLQNQDPLKPTEDKEFIAQLATFNSLSELQSVNKSLTAMSEALTSLSSSQALTQGSALIGKTITGLTTTGQTVMGIVSKAHRVDGSIALMVGTQVVPLDSVVSVEEAAEPAMEG